MITVYGIKNCDTCRKALKWLTAEGLAYRFHDLRAEGVEEAWLRDWLAQLGWARLVNKNSTSWRQLDPAAKLDINDDKAVALLRAQPTLIKRPLFVRDNQPPLVGFRDPQKQALHSQSRNG